MTNELFFHVLQHLGHGMKLADPLTCYRVHDSNMTDRRTPGRQHDYMQQVNTDVAARLREMAKSPPPWAGTRTLLRLSWHLAADASSHTRDAAIQRGLRWSAVRAASVSLVRALIARCGVINHLVGLRSAMTLRSAFTVASGD